MAASLEAVRARITSACASCARAVPPRLVAVSKTHPASAVQEIYNCGVRDFGENYVHEVLEKSPILPSDIRWRFIGHLQSNKVKSLLSVPNLVVVETVHSVNLANALEKECVKQGRTLDVMVQVNTSDEDSKNGFPVSQAIEGCLHVVKSCPHLSLKGLMTIGKPDTSERPAAFETLVDLRKQLASSLGCGEGDLELSMGMSGDMDQAISMGSTSIRVGTAIFGARDYSKN